MRVFYNGEFPRGKVLDEERGEELNMDRHDKVIAMIVDNDDIQNIHWQQFQNVEIIQLTMDVQKMPMYALHKKLKLKRVYTDAPNPMIRDGVVDLRYVRGNIGGHIFDGCVKLHQLHLPPTIPNMYTLLSESTRWAVYISETTEIEPYTFADVKSIISIFIGDNVEIIGEDAFRACTNLQRVDLYVSKVTSIPRRAFANCAKLENVKFPWKLVEIGVYAFSRCFALQKIVLPHSVTLIDHGAFQHCKHLKTVCIFIV
jgi:hypothetical protein